MCEGTHTETYTDAQSEQRQQIGWSSMISTMDSYMQLNECLFWLLLKYFWEIVQIYYLVVDRKYYKYFYYRTLSLDVSIDNQKKHD